jgi:hypothetical protein
MKLATLRLAAIAAMALTSTISLSRAGHVYGGIIDTNGTTGLQAGDALAFIDTVTSSPTYGSAITGESLGVQVMPLVTGGGGQNGLFLTTNISFTGLSNGLDWADTAYRPASPFAAMSGALIQLEIQSVTGPAGATFSFWDEAVSATSPVTSYRIGSGFSIGHGIWNLTDLSLVVGDGTTANPTDVNSPPVDPYGHIHGRSFTVDTPGEYTVSYILHDANGLQADSAPFVVSYSAALDATPTPSPAPPAAAPTVQVSGAKKRTSSSPRIVLHGVATAQAGVAAVQVKTGGKFRTVSRSANWKASIKLDEGKNLIQVRVLDSKGNFSAVQKIVVHRK